MTKFRFVFLILLLLPAFYLVRRRVKFRAVLRHGNHSEIFDYLSNVAKFKELNPTIIGITRWQQTNDSHFYVEYTECLSQVPAVRNYAKAYYAVRHDVDGSHRLLSEHLTCFFSDYLCLSTQSVVHVRKLSKAVVGYEEWISYSCPWALLSFCCHEIAFQRTSIATTLKRIFSKGEHNENTFLQNIH